MKKAEFFKNFTNDLTLYLDLVYSKDISCVVDKQMDKTMVYVTNKEGVSFYKFSLEDVYSKTDKMIYEDILCEEGAAVLESINSMMRKVVLIEPNCIPEEKCISGEKDDFIKILGDEFFVDSFSCFPDLWFIVGARSKISGEPLNRAIYNEDKLEAIIAGPVIITGVCFSGLDAEKIESIKKEFYFPERFFRNESNAKITVDPYKPLRRRK